MFAESRTHQRLAVIRTIVPTNTNSKPRTFYFPIVYKRLALVFGARYQEKIKFPYNRQISSLRSLRRKGTRGGLL